MNTPIRVSSDEAYGKVKSGDSLLVCGYEDEEICRKMRLEGSILLSDFESRLSALSKSREIIFYCA